MYMISSKEMGQEIPLVLDTKHSNNNISAPKFNPRNARSELEGALGLSTVLLTIYSSLLTFGELSQDNVELNIPKLASYSLATLIGTSATALYSKYKSS